LCPSCGADLAQAIRVHLYACHELPGELRSRARKLREATQKLLKKSHEAVDRADVVIREAEAGICAKNRLLLGVKVARVALREAMQRLALPGRVQPPARAARNHVHAAWTRGQNFSMR